jgi:flavin reductase (DIM6/NTAB) family NADH-FMN oxidoreductase RutF
VRAAILAGVEGGPASGMTVSIDTFRAVMSRWSTGVTVITARHEEHSHGMVATSFCSVSADPLLVLFCADHRTRTFPLVEASGAFAVNILSEAQETTFRVFAGWKGEPEADKFAGEAVETALTGSPILKDSLAWLDCRVHAAYPGGTTHTIFLGEVVAAGIGEAAEADVPPLVYYHRKVRTFTPDPTGED